MQALKPKNYKKITKALKKRKTRREGLEPPTLWFEAKYSIHLS